MESSSATSHAMNAMRQKIGLAVYRYGGAHLSACGPPCRQSRAAVDSAGPSPRAVLRASEPRPRPCFPSPALLGGTGLSANLSRGPLLPNAVWNRCKHDAACKWHYPSTPPPLHRCLRCTRKPPATEPNGFQPILIDADRYGLVFERDAKAVRHRAEEACHLRAGARRRCAVSAAAIGAAVEAACEADADRVVAGRVRPDRRLQRGWVPHLWFKKWHATLGKETAHEIGTACVMVPLQRRCVPKTQDWDCGLCTAWGTRGGKGSLRRRAAPLAALALGTPA